MVNFKNIMFYSASVSFFILIVIGIIVPAVNVVDLQKKKDATSDVEKYQKLQDEYILNMFFLILACVGLMVLLFLIIKYRRSFTIEDLYLMIEQEPDGTDVHGRARTTPKIRGACLTTKQTPKTLIKTLLEKEQTKDIPPPRR
jgi:hypothetical protein